MLTKPLGLLGEPLSAAPKVRVLGQELTAPPSPEVDSSMPYFVRWFFT